MRVLKNEPLAKYTTFKIGGPADYFVRVKTSEEMREAVRKTKKLKIPYFLLGGGSNILVGDKGYRGMAIKNEMERIRVIGYRGKLKVKSLPRQQAGQKLKVIYLEAESGVLVNRLVRYTLDQGWSGLENFLGQPGTVGGAIYMNAHNMKADDFFGEHLLEVKVLGKDLKIGRVDQKYFQFGYDQSKIQETGEIVLSCALRLEKEEGKKGKEKLWEKANQVMAYRQKTQPFGTGSSGCVFRNISKAQAIRIGTPNYTCSAGFLLDACGLKGKQIREVKFSEKHANFIVNTGDAKASNVLELIEFGKMKVKEKFGVELKEEIVLVNAKYG